MSISAASINGYSTAQLYQMVGSRTEQLSQPKDDNKAAQKANYSAQTGMTVETNIDNDTLQISEAGQSAYAMSQEQQSQYESATNGNDTDGELKIYNELKSSGAQTAPADSSQKADDRENTQASDGEKIVIKDESVDAA